jgi:hypothetical protein
MKDPIRLRDDASIAPELRELMRRAHGLAPGKEQLRRIQEGVAASHAGPPPSSDALAPKLRPRFRVSRLWLVGAAAAGLVLVTVWVLGSEKNARVAAPIASFASPPSAGHASEGARQAPVQAQPEQREDADVPSPAEAEAAPAAPAAPERPPGRSRSVDRAQDAPRDEADMLHEAKRALPEHPARSLAITLQHARIHPEGLLQEERDALRIEALVRLGHTARASEAFAAFRSRYPRSAYAQRMAAWFTSNDVGTNESGTVLPD